MKRFAIGIVLGILSLALLVYAFLRFDAWVDKHAREVEEQRPCYESLCRPSWSSDCHCDPKAKGERQENGDLFCRCGR